MNNIESGDIVFDIETKKSFAEVKAGGQNNFDKLGVAVIGAYA